MSLDYDLSVIDSTNKDTKEYQLRDCLKDALERLRDETRLIAGCLGRIETYLDTHDENQRANFKYIEKRLENLENGMLNGEMKTPKCMEEEKGYKWLQKGDEYWYITDDFFTYSEDWTFDDYDQRRQKIGNIFKTEEEAEQAVEKLKAWKRLKDAGLKFTENITCGDNGEFQIRGNIETDFGYVGHWIDDMHLLFGDEEYH